MYVLTLFPSSPESSKKTLETWNVRLLKFRSPYVSKLPHFEFMSVRMCVSEYVCACSYVCVRARMCVYNSPNICSSIKKDL